MKSKKIFSIILSLSLMFSGITFCFSQGNGRIFNEEAFNNMKIWAEDYNKNCILSDNNDYTKCTFTEEKDNVKGKVEVIKYNNGDYKVSNSTDVFACDEGDHIWINNGKTIFYQIKDRLITREKLIKLLLNWGILSNNLKEKLNLQGKDEIMRYHFEDVRELWRWWYIPLTVGVAWIGNLIYKNYQLYKSTKEKKNLNPQMQVIYSFDDANSEPVLKDESSKEGDQETENTLKEKEESSKEEKSSDTVQNEKNESSSESEKSSSESEKSSLETKKNA